MDFEKLREPFPAADIEWRIGRAGENDKGVWAMCLAYVTNRAIMQRLDDVIGPGNWRNEYREAPCGGVLCGLSIRIADEWVTKWDGAENTDMEAVKGGLSGAMKRAAVQWGVGRYLYDLPEGWAIISPNGRYYGKTKEGKGFHWEPPELPAWALPSGTGKPPETQADRQTGEVRETPRANKPAPAPKPLPQNPPSDPEGDMIDCPKCGGAMWDNRIGKKNPRAPDLKCKDRDGCDHPIWLDGWQKDLTRDLNAVGIIADLSEFEIKETADWIESRSPAQMLKAHRRLHESMTPA